MAHQDDGPNLIILLSGKRKSGKDHLCEQIGKILKDNLAIVRISQPLKSTYAKNLRLNLEELMGNGPYKEEFRQDMIEWSDRIRQEDPGFFCRAACQLAPANVRTWIVSDIRRKTDIAWFKETYGSKVITVRLMVSDEVRKNRGWAFKPGVDDVASECDLDDYTDWDLKLENNLDADMDNCVERLLVVINKNV